IGASRLGGPPVLPPEVNVPSSGSSHLQVVPTIGAEEGAGGFTLGCAADTHPRRRILIGTCDSELRLRCQYAFRGDAYIVILFKRGANERLKLLIVKNIPPFGIPQRFGGSGHGSGCRHPPISPGNVSFGALVIRPHRAGGREKQQKRNGEA